MTFFQNNIVFTDLKIYWNKPWFLFLHKRFEVPLGTLSFCNFFIWKTEWQGGREGEREHTWAYSSIWSLPKYLQLLGLAWAETKSQELHPSLSQVSMCLGHQALGFIRRKMDQKQRQDLNPSILVWNVGVPRGHLTFCTTMPGPAPRTRLMKRHQLMKICEEAWDFLGLYMLSVVWEKHSYGK